MLIVNKALSAFSITLKGSKGTTTFSLCLCQSSVLSTSLNGILRAYAGGTLSYVDGRTGFSPPHTETLTSDSFKLAIWSVAVVTFRL